MNDTPQRCKSTVYVKLTLAQAELLRQAIDDGIDCADTLSDFDFDSALSCERQKQLAVLGSAGKLLAAACEKAYASKKGAVI